VYAYKSREGALLAMAVVAACGRGNTIASPSSPSSAPATTSTTVAPTTTTTTPDPEQQVIAAYMNFVGVIGRIFEDPNGRPDDPMLVSIMAPEFGREIQHNLQDLRNKHRYTKGAYLVHPQKVDMQPSIGRLLVCIRDDSDQFDQNGIDVSVHKGMGTPQQVEAVLVGSPDERWLMAYNYPTGKGCSL
jgi:hypothetical protein